MKRTLDVPKPGGGVTRCRILATFRARVGPKRLTFHITRMPQPYGETTLTEALSRQRFSEYLARPGERITTAQALSDARAILRMTIEAHGAAHVLKVMARARRVTDALPEFRKAKR